MIDLKQQIQEGSHSTGSTSYQEIGARLEKLFQTIPLYDIESRQNFFADIFRVQRENQD